MDLFFVLSGFLTTTLLVEEWDRSGSISLRRFYVRRGLRLLPALGAYITVVMGLVAFATASGQLDSRHFDIAAEGMAAGVFYVANIAKAGGVSLGPFTHFWSLAEEEQFYFVWPIVLLMCLRRSLSARAVIRVLLAGVAALAAYRLVAALHRGSEAWLLFSPDMRLDPILVGCAAALARSRGLIPALGRLASSVVEGTAMMAAGGAALWMTFSPYMGHAAGLLAFEIASAIIIASVAGSRSAYAEQRRTLFSRSLAFRPLVATGRISYSLYIWQGLFLASGGRSMPATVTAVGASFTAAIVSRRVIELPFLRRKMRYASVRHVTVALPPQRGPRSAAPDPIT